MARRFLSNVRINDAYTLPASDGTNNQVIKTDGSGNLTFAQLAADSASVIYKDTFTGDGSTTAFTMANALNDENQSNIYIDGVYQSKSTYSVANKVITFSTAPASGHAIEVISTTGINSGPTAIYTDNFTANGSTTAFTLGQTVHDENQTLVFLNGVYQFKNTYSLSGTTLTLDTAPANGVAIEVMSIGSAYSGGDILYDHDFTSAGLMKTDGSGTYSIVTDNSSNWNTAYTYSQVGHLPLAGGTVSGNLIVTGDLTINGNTTTLNTQTVEVEDNILQLNTTQGSPDTATATTSGISIYRGNGVTQASFIFDDADDTWDLTNNLSVAGDINLSGTAIYKNSGDLELKAQTIRIKGVTTNENLAGFTENGAVDLYYDNSLRLKTTSGGVNIINDVQISDGVTRLISNQIQAGYNQNVDNTDIWINYQGYQGGTTYFRDFRVGNGKQGEIAHFDGSTSNVTFAGTIDVASTIYTAESLRFDGTGLNATDKKLYSPTDGELQWFTHNLAGAHAFSVSHQGTRQVYLNVSGDSYLNGGDVGIGTTSPVDKLNLHGGSTDNLGIQFNSDAAGSGGGNGFRVGMNGTHSFMWNFRNTPLAFATGGTEKMTLTTSGLLGIGRTLPNSILHVGSTGTNAYSTTITKGSNMKGIINTLSNNADDMVGIYFATGTTTEGTHWSGITGSRTDNASHWGTQLNFYTHNNDVNALNDATQKMVIKGDGKVGIGLTNPSWQLEVEDTGTVRAAINSIDNNTAGVFFRVFNAGTQVGNGTIRTDNAGNMSFFTGTSGEAERIRITSSGNVGIGYTSPSQKLDVNGNVRTIGDIIMAKSVDPRIYAGSAVGLNIDGEALYLNRYSSSNIAMVTGGGNVGINTTSPQRKLDVGGTALIASAGNVNKGTLALGVQSSGSGKWSTITGAHYNAASGSGNGSGSAGIMMIGTHAQNGENDVVIGGSIYEANAATSIQFWTHTTDTSTAGGTRRMIITSNGNVGMGSTSFTPSTGLHLYYQNSAAMGSVLTLGNNGCCVANRTGVGFKDGSYYRAGIVFETSGTDGYAGHIIFKKSANSTTLDGTTETMRIHSSGNVGIGTSSPGATLDHRGSYYNGADNNSSHTFTASGNYSSGTWYDVVTTSQLGTNGIYILQVYVDDFSAGGSTYFCWYASVPFQWVTTGTNRVTAVNFPTLLGTGHAAGTIPSFRITQEMGTSGGKSKIQFNPNNNWTGINNTSGKSFRVYLKRIAG